MGCIRNPNGGQLTGSVQLRQHHRVSPIRLDPIAGFHRNQRGRNDHAFMAKILNRRFVDIHSHEDGIVHQVRPPCLRLCAGLSDAILEWDMPWDGPPDASHSGHKV